MTVRLRFVKISATGNDFAVFDNRQGHLNLKRHRAWCSWLCQRRIAVGADGVILLQSSGAADFVYVHINADGSIAEMCGNGSRAVAFFAHQEGIASSPMRFEIGGRIYTAWVEGRSVTTQFVPPSPPRLELGATSDSFLQEGGFVDTGVPHYVLFVQSVDSIDVLSIGRKYRHHAAFAPRGANVDFVQVVDKYNVRMRTYERGVEDETLACGTGAVASAVIAHLCRGCQSPLLVQVPGGMLRVTFDRDFRHITLSGEVDPIFEGYIDAPA